MSTLGGALMALMTFAATPDLRIQVDSARLASGELDVTLDLVTALPDDPDEVPRLCLAMSDAGGGVKNLRFGKTPIAPMPNDADCFGPLPARRGRFTYVASLRALELRRPDPDYALGRNGTWLFNDQAVLLRPEPLPDPYLTEVSYGGGAAVQTVWPAVNTRQEAMATFEASSAAFAGGAYTALGPKRAFAAMAPISIAGRSVELTRLAAPTASDATTLSRWVENALAAVSTFHGMLPAERMRVFLVPVPGQDSGGIFGTILRRHWATAVLFFGAAAPPSEFSGDWMAVHELFHSVMPHVRERPPWLIEGFTTYYQDVLRARQGMRTAADMWDDLHDAVVRFGQPRDDRSLGQDSRELRQRHDYQRVYWGGACVALCLDVAIRAHSGGGVSLDRVLERALEDSMQTPLDEQEMIERLDQAAGAPIAAGMLAETHAIDFHALYERLGLVAKDDKHVALNDDAPLAALRDAIMRPAVNSTAH